PRGGEVLLETRSEAYRPERHARRRNDPRRVALRAPGAASRAAARGPDRGGRGPRLAPGRPWGGGGAVEGKGVVATTVHSLQVVEADLPATAHDFFLDLIVTPEETIRPRRRRGQPKGILPDHLSEEQRRAIPALRELGIR